MELLSHLPDFILNIDQYQNVLRQEYKAWVYLNLSVIDFYEAGLLVVPFLIGGHSSLFFQNETSIER